MAQEGSGNDPYQVILVPHAILPNTVCILCTLWIMAVAMCQLQLPGASELAKKCQQPDVHILFCDKLCAGIFSDDACLLESKGKEKNHAVSVLYPFP